MSATPGPYELQRVGGDVVEQVIRPTGLIDPEVIVKPTKGQIDDLVHEISERARRDERILVTTLTKKMAEDLTDYLLELGIRARYLHSEVDTLRRVELLRELRLGEYDVLVGINLLREGLDLPEVSLVAILDADKEGFLRSERSLIQTIGRAARNLNGMAILYGDRVTDSMRRAIEETDRRRNKQLAFNEANGIVPSGIKKSIRELIDGVYNPQEARLELQAAQETVKYENMSEKQVAKEIKRLEKLMVDHAKNLEFEKAAQVRDQLHMLKEQLFGAPGADSVEVG